MPSIRLSALAFAWPQSVVFRDVDLHLTPGWTGLVGGNGAGKSTLLRLLAGDLKPTEGAVRRDPPDAVVHLCAQSVEEIPPPPADRRWLGRLGLTEDQRGRWSTLSPGERKRWQLAAALTAEPDVLLLDEPTNHLDTTARALLVEALRRYRGVGIVVCHDRALLDALTHTTVRVHGGTVRVWSAPYEAARRAWEAERLERLEARAVAGENRRRLEQRLHSTRREQAAVDAQRKTRNRLKNRHDSDGRSMGAGIRAEWAEARVGRQVGVVRRAVERAEAAVAALAVEEEVGGAVFLDYEPARVPWVLAVDAEHLGPGGLLRNLHRAVGRTDRIHVAGPNGAGKSTLLAALKVGSRIPADRLLFLPQELSRAEGIAALAAVRDLPSNERGRVLARVAALGVDPDRLLASTCPSPGEARKLLIARGLGLQAQALVLDEPCNHLDLPAIERLEQALAAWPGALVLTSHDERFARACTTVRWHVEGGNVVTLPLPAVSPRVAGSCS